MPYAVLFPGQGSQFVGMGADVFAAHPDLLVDIADEVLGWSLREICAMGPEDELMRTDRAQPALYAVAYALWDEFRRQATTGPIAAAGHSLGEYTALAAAGAIGFADGLRLVAARGRAMAHAAAQDEGGMAALLGADAESAEAMSAACRAGGGALWVANINAPGKSWLRGRRCDRMGGPAHPRLRHPTSHPVEGRRSVSFTVHGAGSGGSRLVPRDGRVRSRRVRGVGECRCGARV